MTSKHPIYMEFHVNFVTTTSGLPHSDVIMGAMASQITSLTIAVTDEIFAQKGQ